MKTQMLDLVESKSLKADIPHFEIGDTDIYQILKSAGKIEKLLQLSESTKFN